MGGERSANLFARFDPASSDRESRAFMQQRLALLLKLLFWSFIPLLAFMNAMYAAYPSTRPVGATSINILAAAGLIAMLGIWLAAQRKSVWSARQLDGLDVLCMTVNAGVFTASGLLSSDQQANVYSSFIWMSFVVFARALIVPSTTRRTIIASSAGILPMMLVSSTVVFDTPRVPQMTGTFIFCIVVVVLSSVGSSVIYGLRTQVKEAMQLGQYTINEKIGEGGMGTVYRASHAMLRRPTAIKLLRPERTGSASLRRFEREVQATAELTHPNTIAIFDYGRSPDGLFYYAMEYLDGVDLETLVRTSGPQPWTRVVHILRQVCGALGEAHDHGLIHRDIKPGNIILCSRGGIPDVAKVLDFGLVKEIAKDDKLTRADIVTGTPAYIAPEAVTDPDNVNATSDLYAVGGVGYYLLCGEQVFVGATVIEMCMHHVSTEPEPPSARTDNEVPRGIEAIIMQCLEKDPSKRPQSAQDLGRALAELANSATTDRWDDHAAARWWREYEAEHDAAPTSPSTISSVTVDVGSRTEVDRDLTSE